MLRIFWRARAIAPLLCAFVALLVSAPAWAQTTGSLRVTVVDADELPVPGTELQLSSAVLIGGVQTRTTDDNGEYLFTQLPPGSYELLAEKGVLGSYKATGIVVKVNVVVQHVIKLQKGEEITVKAVEKAVDTESTARGQVLTKELLNRIPTGRDYQSAIQNAVGVQPGSSGNPNISGGATNENTYMLDGANITDPVTGTFSANFNFDAIQQIEVLLGGYMPEYGVALGGVVNIVTNSGSNNLEFNTSVYYVNGNLARREDERLSADGFQIAPTRFDSQFELFQTAAMISGPVVRDKAWFVISFQNARSVIALSGVPQARDYNGSYILAKLTVQPSPEHRIALFIQSDPTTIDNIDQSGPYVKGEAQGRQVQGGLITNARWQWFLSPDATLDSQLLFQKTFIEVNGVPCTHDRDRAWNQCRPGQAEGYVNFEVPGRIGSYGAYNSVAWGGFYFDDRSRYSATTKLSLLSVEDPLDGSHDFKFGLGADQIVWDQTQGQSGNTIYVDLNTVPFDPSSFSNYYWQEYTGPISFRTTAAEYNTFAQDSWKPVNNLTVNYGSRFDYFIMRNDIGEPVLSGGLLGPRLFAAWDPFGDQRTKVATGYGRFNDTGRLGTASYTAAAGFGGKLFLGEFFGGAFGPSSGFLGSQEYVYFNTPSKNLNVSHDNLLAPRADEVILTLEREVIEDFALFSSMSGRYTRFGYEPDELNLIYDSDGSTFIGSRYSDTQNSYGRLRTPLIALRNYFQWDLGFRKVESHRWAATATYSYTRSMGSSQSSLTGTFMNDPQTQYNYGLFLTDLRHMVKALGYWDLPTDPWTASVGATFMYYDGFPYERRYYAEDFDGYDIRVRPRGSYIRFNPYWDLSLRYGQKFDVRKGQLELSLQVFNIFNNRAPSDFYTGLLDQQSRLQVASRQEPLQVQLGVSYDF